MWSAYVLAWTVSLLAPVPGGEWTVGELNFNFRILFAKAVHLGAYSVLAILTGWLRPRYAYRPLLMFLLMAHGTTTEMLQYLIVSLGRSGHLTDVALDNAGIALGFALSWKWWTGPSD